MLYIAWNDDTNTIVAYSLDRNDLLDTVSGMDVRILEVRL